MITKEDFLKNTNEEELFSVFSSVIERIKENKGYYENSIYERFDYFPSDKEIGKAIKQTLKECK